MPIAEITYIAGFVLLVLTFLVLVLIGSHAERKDETLDLLPITVVIVLVAIAVGLMFLGNQPKGFSEAHSGIGEQL
jgi:NADH:ubiquinone oxidoreductase subunit 6 (subunit J)